MIYFAYGSNMDPAQMQGRCPGAKSLGPALLANYILTFTRWSRSWNSGTADIIPEKGREVWGILYDMTLENLRRLDRFADYPTSYVRQDVFVKQGKEVLPAFTYVAVRQGAFAPSKAYLNKMVVGASGSSRIPEKYVAFLKTIETHD
ncbi:MAG: gamma-glutamylcyclotransferase family protein [Nitrospirota bacterium]